MEAENGRGTTLVLGGTGKTGSRVAGRLEAGGLPVRIGSRAGEPPFDWEDRGTWESVLRGRGVGIRDVSAGSGGTRRRRCGPGFRRSRGGERGPAAGFALRAGRGWGRAWRGGRAGVWRGVDDPAVEFLRPELQRELLSGARARRRARAPCRGRGRAVRGRRGHSGRGGRGADPGTGTLAKLYELTGPRLLTFGEAVGEISRAAGREVRYVPVSYRRVRRRAGARRATGGGRGADGLSSSPRSWTVATPT